MYFFQGLEMVVGALLLVIATVAGVLFWLQFSSLGAGGVFSGAHPGCAEDRGNNATNMGGSVRVLWICNLGGGVVLPRVVYVYKHGGVVCFAGGFPWVVGAGRLVYLDVWMPVGPPSDVSGGAAAGCREPVASEAVYVANLVTARGAGNQ